MEALSLMDQLLVFVCSVVAVQRMIEVTLFKLFLTSGRLSNQLPLHKWMPQ